MRNRGEKEEGGKWERREREATESGVSREEGHLTGPVVWCGP